ncbi:MAG TPA: DUF839 domain-containing protein, partial [Planctomycetota bacterium]|nr:DUF839 domain-containing protein [Planctomycetota bacterium]
MKQAINTKWLGAAGFAAGLVGSLGAQSFVAQPAGRAGLANDLGVQASNNSQWTPATSEASMLRGDTAATNAGFQVTPLLTIGETVDGYQPVGILDGIGAFAAPGNRVQVLVNHELGQNSGYPYALANGTLLTGARISSFVVKRTVQGGQPEVSFRRADLAFRRVYDRFRDIVTDPAQINETGVGIDGFSRFCSAQGVAAGTYGFVDDIFFTGEETSKPAHPHGGSVWALDVHGKSLWAVPAIGRGAWENVTPLDTGDCGHVALLCGDDSAGAPLYLYIGEKDAVGDGSFLDRNGLRYGHLYAWAAQDGSLSPEDFHGVNSTRAGSFVELTPKIVCNGTVAGYDAQGYADIDTLQAEADALGCFSFSRPEDLSTNPLDGTQAVFSSTGRGSLYPSDNWGTLYVIDVDFQTLDANLVIVHDADGLVVPDAGIRSPDNVEWALNGKIYAQEDRSTSPSSLFGAATGIEAS